ncbi:phosphotransferase family protein [Mycobacteroides abscessus]|uniref:phosphotransferase family protein n=1 Tax=Mycobacteroides abscessus TaxID=36809 RepID=UPI001A967D78|nr:phosphotransferase family protein [Mycobacteroides abscessus]
MIQITERNRLSERTLAVALKNVIDTELAAHRLTEWLGRKVDGAQDFLVTDLSVPKAGGLSNETVMFSAAWTKDGQRTTRHMVARVQPSSPGVFPQYNLDKEARVLAALAEHSTVPVPQVHFLSDDSSIFGAPFLVMSKVDGRVPADDPPFTAAGWVLEELSPAQRQHMWHNSIDALAAIHAVDWRASGLEFLDAEEHHRGLDACLNFWEHTFEWAAEGEPNPTINAAFAWLRNNKPTDTSPLVLNWGDARVGNILYTNDLTPAAVLDWEMVELASREQDLGWWLFMARYYSEGLGLQMPPGVPDRDETLRYYERITGYTVRDIDYYEAWAGTRLAILMVRAAHMMIEAGLLPPDVLMSQSNPASQSLARLLGLPAPDGATVSFVGNRG